MFALAIEFITGRYAATAYARRDEGEWPVHPARVFSSLVATLHDGVEVDPEEEAALKWLEQQGPPALRAGEAHERAVLQHWVPVNDIEVVGTFDDEQEAVHKALQELREAERRLDDAESSPEAGGRSEAARDLKRCTSAYTKAQGRLETKLRNAISLPPGKEASQSDLDAAVRVLPAERSKQGRNFPVVIPPDEPVVLSWPEATPGAGERKALAQLTSRVVRVGSSSSFVRMWVTDDPGTPTWKPDDAGDTMLRVVQAGQLSALREAFEHHRETEPRIMPASPQRYARVVPPGPAPLAESLLGHDWTTFQITSAPPSIVDTVLLTETLRAALMSHSGRVGSVPRLLSGHEPDGKPTTTPHAAFLALPWVAQQHADGCIRGLVLALPAAATPTERDAVLAAIGEWEAQASAGEGENSETPELTLTLGRRGVVTIRRVEGPKRLATLTSTRWTQAATTWVSATPVALDGFPGPLDLRSSSPVSRAAVEAAEAKACAMIAQACERIGLPRPVEVHLVGGVPMRGSRAATAFPKVVHKDTGTARVKVHAAVRFDTAVRGPIVLGAARHRGLGLFLPLVESP